ncbi:NADH-quinone oxidoreductase subunit L [Zavarzinia sp. CC-PAN008]|uniref:NADH-quinone oxidoreductase subunit L n=1 Tax=Zavarzinia sp. CC-PAN008 TaxID=3243332 RepID=UPI003F743838
MITAIVFLPLLGAILAGFFGRILGKRASQWITSGLLVAAAVLSWFAFVRYTGQPATTLHLLDWINSGSFQVSWALRIDTLTAMMLVVVTNVSALVHIYSVGYMADDPHVPRFMAYLSLFTFAMLMLVTADNFVQLYFGWEGVGLASYLLIGFWYQKPSANAAAIKAFVVNRVGDFGFALGIMAIFLVFREVSFDAVFAAAPAKAGQTFDFLGAQFDILTTICLLLFVGAMGKSAQLLLHTWLPDAMEGPTPVSALIHAATMVTAGVFMVARCSPMFELAPDALTVVTIVGALTAFFAASVGLVQNDIKRVIAYSTCSQLGYMFFAAGVSAYQASVFHLFTHAFFKALLFLGAGAVIHAMHHEQDLRNMGGLWRKIPFTYAMMWIGSLALVGLPFFAGYYSKDAILEAAYAFAEVDPARADVGHLAFALGIVAAFFTAFYSGRLIFMAFHGKPHDHHHYDHAHEAPLVMTVPLLLLAVGAVAAGFTFYDSFVGHHWKEFFAGAIVPIRETMDAAHHVPTWVKLAPAVMGVLGLAVSWWFYVAQPWIPRALATANRPLYLFLLNKWYFDELYNLVFVKPALWFGRLFWRRGDQMIIDGFGPDGVAATVAATTRQVVRIQTGFIYHYAFAMLIGVAVLITWIFLRFGPPL